MVMYSSSKSADTKVADGVCLFGNEDTDVHFNPEDFSSDSRDSPFHSFIKSNQNHQIQGEMNRIRSKVDQIVLKNYSTYDAISTKSMAFCRHLLSTIDQ
ncbi:unnamed protein product [Bursaphelenchus xylophilus]|uniref:(pine wood nematode) hypothetical protein n=1 Tax=Bursaphelenchus xylophilus TaxID=6326 RepID=A0A811KKL2_BURXY|nr:unnamed protein product [Bursaphelenchus xylophilus]CAG9098203.1 unnamed protein product [Bursaphelenchus xylophilus]